MANESVWLSRNQRRAALPACRASLIFRRQFVLGGPGFVSATASLAAFLSPLPRQAGSAALLFERRLKRCHTFGINGFALSRFRGSVGPTNTGPERDSATRR